MCCAHVLLTGHETESKYKIEERNHVTSKYLF